MSVATLTDLRQRLADAVSPGDGGDLVVIPYISDAVAPPVLVVGWDEPWLDQDDTGQCRYTGHLRVWVVTVRTEPASGTPELEQMVSDVLRRIAADPYPWSVQVGQPSTTAIGGISYLCAIVAVTAPTVPNSEV